MDAATQSLREFNNDMLRTIVKLQADRYKEPTLDKRVFYLISFVDTEFQNIQKLVEAIKKLALSEDGHKHMDFEEGNQPAQKFFDHVWPRFFEIRSNWNRLYYFGGWLGSGQELTSERILILEQDEVLLNSLQRDIWNLQSDMSFNPLWSQVKKADEK